MAAAVFLISIDALVGTVPAQHAVNHAADQRNAGAAAVGIARAIAVRIAVARATVIDRSAAVIATAIAAATVVAAAGSGEMTRPAARGKTMSAMSDSGMCAAAGVATRGRESACRDGYTAERKCGGECNECFTVHVKSPRVTPTKICCERNGNAALPRSVARR